MIYSEIFPEFRISLTLRGRDNSIHIQDLYVRNKNHIALKTKLYHNKQTST